VAWHGLNDQELDIVALNDEELHALLRLRGQLHIQEPPLQMEEASESLCEEKDIGMGE
jgi:hypothetical protein